MKVENKLNSNNGTDTINYQPENISANFKKKPFDNLIDTNTFLSTTFTEPVAFTHPEQFLNISGIDPKTPNKNKNLSQLETSGLKISSQKMFELESENAALKVKNSISELKIEMLLKMASDEAKEKIKRFESVIMAEFNSK